MIGVVRPQIAMQGEAAGLPAQDQNNVIYVPLMSAIMRIEDALGYYKDEIDGIYIGMAGDERVAPAGIQVRGLLDTTHNGAGDFSIIVPAELLAQQERTKRLFEFVMVAIASISLLVGGIGIMNIMLASVTERTREIGVRRAVGARKVDVIRQFLIETTLITISGGLAGTMVGIGLSRLVLETRQPQVSHEFRSDPRSNPTIRDYTPAGWGGVVVPIRAANEIIGIMRIAVQLPREIQPDAIALETFTDIAEPSARTVTTITTTA